MVYGNAPRTQAEWDANRAEVKAEAAKTVKAEAKKAKKARDKVLRVGLDVDVKAPEFVTESQAPADETVVDEKTPEVTGTPSGTEKPE